MFNKNNPLGFKVTKKTDDYICVTSLELVKNLLQNEYIDNMNKATETIYSIIVELVESDDKMIMTLKKIKLSNELLQECIDDANQLISVCLNAIDPVQDELDNITTLLNEKYSN